MTKYELYSALQTGVVDGAEQPIANYKSNAFQEVAPNLILDGHTLGAIHLPLIPCSSELGIYFFIQKEAAQ